MNLNIAIILGKIINLLSQYLNIGGGSAAPGYYALQVCPNLIEKLSKNIPNNIVITGTNGKTTTAKLIAQFAKTSGQKIIRNHTGSNMERGIASTLIQNAKFGLTGFKLNFDLGIWELDEAAFNTIVPKLKPQTTVFLNVFRDQLDRYGEIDSVVKNWCKTLENMPANSKILINGDDANTLKLAKCFKGKVQKFGVRDYKIIGEGIKKLKEDENLDFEATDVKLNGLNGSVFQLKIENSKLKINLPLPGIYHIYDALAAISCAHLLNLPIQRYTDILKHYQPAFGRVEKLPFGYIFLIKNPAGATQVFETIAPQLKNNDKLLLALNDNLADGTDVSWIWDADFEVLHATSGKLQVICSGQRANDLAIRLKYAGFDPKNIKIEPSLGYALQQARKGLKANLFILPTYTAMLELQTILTKAGIKKHYWKENA